MDDGFSAVCPQVNALNTSDAKSVAIVFFIFRIIHAGAAARNRIFGKNTCTLVTSRLLTRFLRS